MITRRGFLAALGAVAAAPAAALAPAPAAVDAPPLMFHRDAFALVMAPIHFDTSALAARIDAMAERHVMVTLTGRFDDEGIR